MKRLFLISLIVLFFTIGAWAQPVNVVQHLACDDIPYISKSEVRVNNVTQDPTLCLWDLRADDLRNIYSVAGFTPGVYTFDARVFGRTSDDPTEIEQWSGYSNTLTGRKPDQATNVRYSNGHVVCDPQSDLIATYVHINGVEQEGLNEVVDNELRLYPLSETGTYEIYVCLMDISGWRSDYTENPLVVTVGNAPPAPVLMKITE